MKTILLTMAAAFALLVAAAAPARAQVSYWQVYSYGSEPGDVALIFGPNTQGGQPYYPGLFCPNRGQLTLRLYLADRFFPNHRHDGSMVNARGLAGPWQTTVRVTAGPVTASLPGVIEYDDIGDVIELRATLPHGSPLVAALVRTGRLQATINGYTTRFTAITPAQRRRLTTYCTGY